MKHIEEKRKSLLQSSLVLDSQALFITVERALAADILAPLGTRSRTEPRWKDEKSSKKIGTKLGAIPMDGLAAASEGMESLIAEEASPTGSDVGRGGPFGAWFSQFPLREG